MNRAVLLVSGGIESLVITALLRERHPDWLAHAFFVDYGQRALEEEERAVQTTSRRYGLNVEYVKVELPFLSDHWLVDPNKSIIPKPGAPKGTGHIVPYRNLLFLGMCASYAEHVGAGEIWTGFDFRNRPDSARDKSPEFVDSFNTVLQNSSNSPEKPKVTAPLQYNSKGQTIKEGMLLGVDWTESWSCYNNFLKPCGVCGSCLLRLEGFKEVGMKDPVEYCTAEDLKGE